MALLWLVGCVPAEPIEVTRVVGVTMTATMGVTETAEPTGTPTVTVIPSPVVEATTRPTRTATAVPTVPSPSATPLSMPSMSLPVIGHDLLFVADGSLKRWSYERGQVEVLLAPEAIGEEVGDGSAGQITLFELSGDGTTVVATQLVDATPLTHRFIVYDLESGAYRVLDRDVPYLLDYAVAADGRYLAYIEGDPAGDRHDNGRPMSGTIYLTPTDVEELPRRFGYCSNIDASGEHGLSGCWGITWTPDNEQVIWADIEGLWGQGIVNGSEPRLLAANSFNFATLFAVYRPSDWSPSGRYLRLVADHYEGFHEAIFDFETGNVLAIPYSRWFIGSPVTTHLTWLESDRLFSVRGGSGDGELVAEVLRIEAEVESFVVESSLIVPSDESNYASGPVQLESGLIAFSLLIVADEVNDKAGLYIVDLAAGTARKVNDWPFDSWTEADAIWSPDGRCALVRWYRGGGYDFIYVPADGGVFYEVRPLLGESVLPFSLTWVP
jgi:hypothetical protein